MSNRTNYARLYKVEYLFLLVVDHYVVGLHISMHYSLRMAVIQRLKENKGGHRDYPLSVS